MFYNISFQTSNTPITLLWWTQERHSWHGLWWPILLQWLYEMSSRNTVSLGHSTRLSWEWQATLFVCCRNKTKSSQRDAWGYLSPSGQCHSVTTALVLFTWKTPFISILDFLQVALPHELWKCFSSQPFSYHIY
jgi:hypothetical protein